MTAKEFRQSKKPDLGIYKAGDVWHKEWDGYLDYIKGGYYIVSGKSMTIKDEHDCNELMIEYARIKCQELLEIVAEKAEIIDEDGDTYKTPHIFIHEGEEYKTWVDKESILNAVDLNKFIA